MTALASSGVISRSRFPSSSSGKLKDSPLGGITSDLFRPWGSDPALMLLQPRYDPGYVCLRTLTGLTTNIFDQYSVISTTWYTLVIVSS